MITDRREPSTRGRVVFLVTVPPQNTDAFLAAYEAIRHDVASGVDGHIVDEVCRCDEDPDQWLITSSWESLQHFRAWESTEAHREQAGPLRACITRATSLKFEVVRETRGNTTRTGGTPHEDPASSC